MKKYVTVFMLLAIASTAVAMIFGHFESWNSLIEESPDIIIARCTATLDAVTTKRVANMEGIVSSDIEAVSILKGNTKPGRSRMKSWYWPSQGEQFLLFANYQHDQNYTGYTAIESYRIVPLNRNFLTNELSGKSLSGQVQLILNRRLKDLNDELTRDANEKKRIEMDMSSNVPALTIPPRGGSSF